jgi:hypothetical protein
LLLVVIVVAAPVLYFRRLRTSKMPVLFMILFVAAATSGLYLGIEFVSLQELTGAACIAGGLLFRKQAGRITLWTLAAWFKAPFAWMLIANGVVAWRRGEKRAALTSAGLGVATIAVAALWSRSGSYTSAYSLNPVAMWENIPRLLEPVNVYLVVALVWWATMTGSRLRVDSNVVLFGIGFSGYVLQLLPWGVTAYYSGPITWLLGLLLLSALGEYGVVSRSRMVAAYALPTLITFLLVAWPVRQVLQTNAVMRGVSDCLAGYPNSNSLLAGNMTYVTGPEGPIRMKQNLQLRDPTWHGDITYEPDAINVVAKELADGIRSTTSLILVGPGNLQDSIPVREVCLAGTAKVYFLDNQGTA